MENELLDDIWRQADSDSFILYSLAWTRYCRALYTVLYLFEPVEDSIIIQLYMGDALGGVDEMFIRKKISRDTNRVLTHTAWG